MASDLHKYADDFDIRMEESLKGNSSEDPDALLKELVEGDRFNALSELVYDEGFPEQLIFLRFAIDFLMEHDAGTRLEPEHFVSWVLNSQKQEYPFDLDTLVEAVGPIVGSDVTDTLRESHPRQQGGLVASSALSIEEQEDL